MKSTFVQRVLFRVVMIAAAFALTSQALAAAGPCSTNQESRQLDYWLGSWTIHHQEGPGTASSNVSPMLDQCLVVENWKDSRGHEGRNFFGYNPGEKTWHGMFADNQGHVHLFTDGKVTSGVAEFHGTSRGDNGETVLNRLRVVRKSADKVEQTWEQSSDNGANWKLVFHGEYTRAATAAAR